MLNCPFCWVAAELAATRKKTKYTELLHSYIFQPVALETHGTMSVSVLDFFNLKTSYSTQLKYVI